MKYCCIIPFSLIVLIPLLSSAQEVIGIDDRKNLPQAVYDSMESYQVILCGEMHGTNEAPEFLEGMTKLWLNNKQKVILALEIPEADQKYIDTFLLSRDFSILMRMPFFTRKIQDGRSSVAMANLLKNLYGQKNLKVVFIDPNNVNAAQERDSVMAENVIAALKNNPNHKLILLAGNLHSKLTKGILPIPTTKSVDELNDELNKLSQTERKKLVQESRSSAEYTPLGYILENNQTLKNSGIAALKIVFNTGTFWACTYTSEPCGRQVASDQSQWENFSVKENFFYKQPIYKTTMGYIGVLCSKHISASPPFSTH